MNDNNALLFSAVEPPVNLQSGRITTLACMIVLFAVDGVSLVFACRAGGLCALPWGSSRSFDVEGFVALVSTLLSFVYWRHYNRRKPALRELREILLVLLLACLLHVSLFMLDGARNGTQAAMRAWVYAALFVPSGRVLAKLLLMKFRLWQRNLIVIGSGRVAFDAAAAIESEPLMGFCIRGFVQVGDDVPPTNTPLLRFRPTDASLLAEAHVLVAIEEKHAAARSAWLRALNSYRATNVMLVTDVSGVPLHGAATTYVKSHDLLLVQVRDNLSRWHVRLAKRCLDLAGAIAVSLVLSPLLLFIAWRVRRDGGRAIYGHPRIGRDGRAFRCYKFRSMVVDADRVLAELLKNDVTAREEWERDFKLKNDPRVTRIGRFLRRTSLDELPQLWNVIRGEMSLVGPRPIVEAELLRYGDDSCYYLMARPGMTGLWQVSGRNDADYRTRVYLDAWYVRNWSLWYDVAILFKTALVVFRRDGAY